MSLTDYNLRDLLSHLSPHERQMVAAHLRGKQTPQSWALMRRLRFGLKRRARSRR